MRGTPGAPSVRKRERFPKADGEDGRISLLMLGLSLITFMVIAALANVTVLHLEYVQLQFESDNLVTNLALGEPDPSYYSHASSGQIGELSLNDAQLKLNALVPADEDRIVDRRVISVETEGELVSTEVAARLKIPLLTNLLGVTVDTLVFSSARRKSA